MKRSLRFGLVAFDVVPTGQSTKQFFLLAFFTVLAALMPDKMAWAAGPQGTNFGYDKCTGYIYAEYYSSNDYDAAPDDYAQWGNLFYKDANGNWVQLLNGNYIGRYGSNKFFAVTSVPGTARGYASDRYPVAGADGADDAEYRARIVLFNMPTDAKYPYELRLQLNWREDHTFGSDDINDVYHESGAIYTQAITAHSVVSASTDQCGQVVVSWDNPQQAWEAGSGCSVGTQKYFDQDLNATGYFGSGQASNYAGNKLSGVAQYFTDIYRNDVFLVTVAGTVTSYTDATVQDYQQYTYRIRRHLQYRSYTWNTPGYYNVSCSGGNCNSTTSSLSNGAEYNAFNLDSPLSPSATGRTLIEPAIPSNFAGSRDECASAIELTWDWNSNNNPQDFLIYRSSVTSGPYSLTATVDGNQRSYLDESNIIRGTRYYYQIKTRNTCSILSSSYAGTSGISPPDPVTPTVVTATLNSTYDTINVRWTDNAINETKYQVVRQDNLGNTVTYDVNKQDGSGGTITYKDAAITSCRSYTYSIKVFNDCVQSGLISVSVQTSGPAGNLVPPPNLGSTFDLTTKKLTASKGYFNNRVELGWNNNNNQHIDRFKIYRKINGTSFDSTLVGTASAGAGFYSDNTADSRVYYKYTIVGIKNCNDTEVATNSSEDIGFRNPTGNVSGHIEYNGGIALKGAKVIIQQAGSITGTTLRFAPNETLTMENASTLGLSNQLRMEFWFKPKSTNTSQSIIEKANVFSFKRNGANYEATVNVGGTNYTITAPETKFPLDNWEHVSMQYTGDSVKLYINGVRFGGRNVTVHNTPVNSQNNKIVMGGANTSFLIDEFRLLSVAQPVDSLINIDHARYINSSEVGVKISLHFDENYGNHAYDGSSQNSVYNANHFVKTTGVTWSLDKPSSAQLSYYGITDALGNYSVAGIAFAGTGENFTIIPSYLTHSFTPNSRSVYLGDAATVFSNQDFVDNSSFAVSGDLFYGESLTERYCAVPDAVLKIDGNVVMAYGQQVKTNAQGNFAIEVPIGKHYIEVELYGHTMAVGRFPATGVYNFQDDLASIHFVDSTKRTIVGRVVGGLVEANKIPGLGKSKNNIGQATIRISTPVAATVPCYSKAVTTNATTGEYRLDVYPMQYQVASVALVNDAYKLNASNTSNTNVVIDLRNVAGSTTARDTLRNATGQIVQPLHVDSVVYHKRLDMIYREAPAVDVVAINATPANAGKFIGEMSLTEGSATISLTPDGTHPWGAMGYPVFKEGIIYQAKIKAEEVYTNIDDNVIDRVQLSGKAQIFNQMDTVSSVTVNISNGTGIYKFKCSSPNTSLDGTNPSYSATKTLQIDVTPNQSLTKHWEPNGTGNGTVYRAYVFGANLQGAGVQTLGPEKVDYILRDPPGSGSYAVWEAGTSNTTTKYTSYIQTGGMDIKEMFMVGSEAVLGIGVGAIQDSYAALGVQVDWDISEGSNSYKTTTETTLTTISTRGDENNVGAEADLFIGKSFNMIEGITLTVKLVDAASCASFAGNGVGCFGATVQGKRMAIVPGIALGTTGIATRFIYTQAEIESVVIPKLQSKRNSFLNGTNPQYVSNVSASHRLFGSNNDDPLWKRESNGTVSTETPTVDEVEDATGKSYTYTSIANNQQDSVRIMNMQIALWKRALARNEMEKIGCVRREQGYTFKENVTLGSGIFTNSYGVSDIKEYHESWEYSVSNNIVNQMQVLFSNNGMIGENSVTINENKATDDITNYTHTNTFTYTFTDGNPGDILSADVFSTSTGNVFITRGGQTMCPYEGELDSHYYDPANPQAFIGSHTYNANGFGSPIQVATQKREIPVIQITPVNQVGIPSNQAAVYKLNLRNDAITNYPNDVQMRIFVASQSNPNGAVVKIDGLDPNTLYTIPKGASVTKTLTVERGPIEINYDNLMIVFASACSDDIADTVKISAHFIPTCTELDMTAPNDNWVFNNSTLNRANIVISGYNYNYGAADDNSTTPATKLGFSKIGLEVRPSSSSTWTEYSAFYKYPTVDQAIIPSSQVYSQYLWDISTIPDGAYELKAKSYCLNKDGSYSIVESPVHRGVMDRINPSPFGTPSPGDGILDPNDDISIKFNESVDIGALSSKNFDVRAVINGGNSRQSESLSFDGVTSYAEVPSVALQKRSFTVEFWAQLNGTGVNQTVMSQGTDVAQSLAIGFDATNRLTISIGAQSVASDNPVSSPTDWHHYAAVYDYTMQTVNLYVNGVLANSANTSLFSDYNGQGKFVFGKKLPSNTNYFNGNLSDVRLWNKAQTIGNVVLNMNKDLSNTSSGLVYNWKMNEAEGSFTHDAIRSLDAVLYGTSWRVTPNGYAAQFDGVDDRMAITSSTVSITQEMDFTLEFWFKSNQAGVATLFSNGKGDGLGSDSLYAWNIQKDAAGFIHVLHNKYDFVATSKNYFDNQWHHFALVMQRTANLSSYIDGNLQHSVQARSFKQMGGAYMHLGTRGYYNGMVANYDNYYSGLIDEFRFWNTARKVEQVKRDKQFRVLGDEYGLMAFVPFESYATDPTGIPILTSSFKDYSADILSVHKDSVFVYNGVATTNQTPALKLPRPVESISFTYSVNNDQIIITPTTSEPLIENVTLDVTVKDVYDLRGNKMQSAKTWIAFVNKNQVLWQDVEKTFIKTSEEVTTFKVNIVNNGGALKQYTIGGLPSWMTASQTSGDISPNSVQSITFTIPAGTPVGEYDAELTLATDFGYEEVLRINLKVVGQEPVWVVNPANYKYSMSIIGEIRIDGVTATNTSTKIGAFINNMLCGVANLKYMAAYDRYELFLNVYSNHVTGDSIRFQVYDATTGTTFVNVLPAIMFEENNLLGDVNMPVTFVANTEVSLDIPLKSGWTWISLPLKSNQLQHSNLLMADTRNEENNIIRSIDAYDQYTASLGWIGTISSRPQRFTSNQMYQIKRGTTDTLTLIGERIHPDSAEAEINVVPGWNWIGFVSVKNAEVNTAMSGYHAVTGDILKSQYEFAYYDSNTGWVGSLTTMRPGLGYMLKSTANSVFHYPASVFYGSTMNGRLASGANESDGDIVSMNYDLNAEGYERNMSVIAKSNLCDELKTDRNVILGAFDDQNVLRGYARPSYNGAAKDHLYYLTVYGNLGNESLHLKYINLADGTAVPAEVSFDFAPDALLGTLFNPMQVNAAKGAVCFETNEETAQAVRVYPNPFNDILNIEFGRDVNVRLVLTDVLGKVHALVESENKSSVILQLKEMNLPDGVYLLRMSGDVQGVVKVVKAGK